MLMPAVPRSVLNAAACACLVRLANDYFAWDQPLERQLLCTLGLAVALHFLQAFASALAEAKQLVANGRAAGVIAKEPQFSKIRADVDELRVRRRAVD